MRQVTRRFQVDKEGRCRRYLEAVLQSQMLPTFTEICEALSSGDFYLNSISRRNFSRLKPIDGTNLSKRKYRARVSKPNIRGI